MLIHELSQNECSYWKRHVHENKEKFLNKKIQTIIGNSPSSTICVRVKWCVTFLTHIWPMNIGSYLTTYPIVEKLHGSLLTVLILIFVDMYMRMESQPQFEEIRNKHSSGKWVLLLADLSILSHPWWITLENRQKANMMIHHIQPYQ